MVPAVTWNQNLSLTVMEPRGSIGAELSCTWRPVSAEHDERSRAVRDAVLLCRFTGGHASSTAPRREHLWLRWVRLRVAACIVARTATPALLLPLVVDLDQFLDQCARRAEACDAAVCTQHSTARSPLPASLMRGLPAEKAERATQCAGLGVQNTASLATLWHELQCFTEAGCADEAPHPHVHACVWMLMLHGDTRV